MQTAMLKGKSMSEIFVISIERIITFLFFCAAGYVLYAKDMVPKSSTETISKISLQVMIPLMLFNSLAQDCTIDKLGKYTMIFITGTVVLIVCWLISIPSTKLLGGNKIEQLTNTYSIVVPNAGFFGTPFVLALFGTEMVAKFCVFYLALPFYVYIIAINDWDPNANTTGWKKVLSGFKNPALIGTLAGALYGLSGLPYPNLIKNIGDAASQSAGPIAMMLTGMTVARMGISKCFSNKMAYTMTIIKLVITPLVMIPVAYLLGKYTSMGMDIVVTMGIYAALPLGLNTIIFAEDYGQDGTYPTQTAVISTLGSMITMPICMMIIMKLAEMV